MHLHHKEILIEKGKEWYKKNKEKHNKLTQEYYKNNIDKMREQHNNYYKLNKNLSTI